MSSPRPDSPAPLAGICVVELGHSVAAPFAGQILGDLGADIVKVEKPSGDDARKWGPPFIDGAASVFQALNRNKRSVVCDLRDPAQFDALRGFIQARADVVLQNMRPGQADAVGLGATALMQTKPSLIYANLGAFGARGPLSDRPGYDPLMQAFAGIMSTTGEEGRPPVRVGASIVDMGTGMWAVIGILTALRTRDATGRGSVVDVSLLETAACWVSVLASHAFASGEVPRRNGSGQTGIVPYRAFQTSDGWVVIAAGNDDLFRRFSGALGHAEWPHDPRFGSNPDRVRNANALHPLIEAEMARRPTADWIARLDEAGVPCAPVQNVCELMQHPQVQALGLLQRAPGATLDAFGLPLSFDGARPQPRSASPALGAHTREVLG